MLKSPLNTFWGKYKKQCGELRVNIALGIKSVTNSTCKGTCDDSTRENIVEITY